MLLGNSELQLGVALCRLLFFKAFLLSPPSAAGRTHIKQLSEGIEVNFCWLAALSGGSVVLANGSLRTSGKGYSEKANTALKNRSAREEFMAPLQLILPHWGQKSMETLGFPLLAERKTARVSNFRLLITFVWWLKEHCHLRKHIQMDETLAK